MSRPLSPSDDSSLDFIQVPQPEPELFVHVTEPVFDDRVNETVALPVPLTVNQPTSTGPLAPKAVTTPEIIQSMEERKESDRMKEEKRQKEERADEMRVAMARESIAIIREKQEKLSLQPVFFSRRCLLCQTRQPTHRVVFSSCGHISCQACQMEARLEGDSDQCPQCKSESGWSTLLEERDDAPLLPPCVCSRVRRRLGQLRDSLRRLFNKK